MSFPKGYLLGGAIAANQVEGVWNIDWKGWSAEDVQTFKPKVDVKDYKANVHTSLEGIRAAMVEPDPPCRQSAGVSISITITKRILHCLRKWNSRFSACPLPGQEYSNRRGRRTQ